MKNQFINRSVFSLIITILLVTHLGILAQGYDDPVLVTVGNKTIRKSEFVNRLNFSPIEGIQDKNKSDGIKTELLYTLIAEKLWTNYAIELGLENDELVTASKRVIEKMFVRDELYHQEIKKKIKYSEEDIRTAKEKYEILITARLYSSSNKERIFNVYESLISSGKVSELDSENVFEKILNIKFGDLPEKIENEIFALKLNDYSGPILMDGVWNIFVAIEKNEQNIDTADEGREALKKINEVLSKRSEKNNFEVFYDNFFENRKVDVDGKIFKLIAKEFSLIFKNKLDENIFVKAESGEEVIFFDRIDLQTILRNIDIKSLKEPFILFKDKPISTEEFLYELNALTFTVTKTDYDHIKILLNKKLKEYIKHEMLAREGIKRGLHKSNNVQKWTKIWYENFLFKNLKNQYLKNEDEIIFTSENSNVLDSNNSIKNKNVSEEFKNYIDKTIELSNKYIIDIDFDLLKDIKLGNINLFVYRKLGFGGTIPGVPKSQPFIEWYLKKENQQVENL